MVHAQLDVHHGTDGDGVLAVLIGDDHGGLAHGTDRQDGGLGAVDDGGEVADAEHAQVGDGEGAVGVLGGREWHL